MSINNCLNCVPFSLTIYKQEQPEKGDVVNQIAQLVEPYWNNGERHGLALHLSGYLFQQGLTDAHVEEVIKLCSGNDEELKDRLRAKQDTSERMSNAESIKGYTGLKDILPGDILTRIEELSKQLIYGNDLFIRVSDIKLAKWIVEGIAMEQGLTVIYGDTGAGKTTLVLQIIDALNKGVSLFGLEVMPVKALLIEQDEAPMVFKNHWTRVLPELSSLKDMVIPAKHVIWKQVDNTGYFENLSELIRAYPARLVIIDSFTSLGVPDLNHPSTSHLLDAIRQVNAKENCSCILLHHEGKDKNIFGSQTLRIKADNIIKLNDKGLTFQKTRGVIKNVDGDKLHISRGDDSILFKLPMSKRAEVLIESGVSENKAIEILRNEYKTTPESARITVIRCRKPSVTKNNQ